MKALPSPTPGPTGERTQLVQCLWKEAMEVPLIITEIIIGARLLPSVFKGPGASPQDASSALGTDSGEQALPDLVQLPRHCS